jgi:tetratricopeptide (TPR) repeat protein
MVAEEYYANNEYQNALRWALTANEINPKNEKSWMIFAMSKAKLNLPDEGIMALEEYLKNNNSGKIESLLISLKRGTFQ